MLDLKVIIEKTPPWSQEIAYTSVWKNTLEEAFSNISHLKYTHFSTLFPYKGEALYDSLYIEAKKNFPNTHEFIQIFQGLKIGATLFIEGGTLKWNLSEIKKLAASLGSQVLYYRKKNRLLVLQKINSSMKKNKINILIPILSNQDTTRILDWLSFLKPYHLMNSVQFVLIFDGIPNLLPAWPEVKDIDLYEKVIMLSHYRSFGLQECLRSSIFFSNAKDLFWDGEKQNPMVCSEILNLYGIYKEKSSTEAKVIFPIAIQNKNVSQEIQNPNFFYFNHIAGKLFYEFINTKEESLVQNAKLCWNKQKAKIYKNTYVNVESP